MISKFIKPLIDPDPNGMGVVGTRVEYRLFGILIYRKVMHSPSYYGITEWDFTHRI